MRLQVLPQVLVGPLVQDGLDLVTCYQQLFRESRELVRARFARMIVYLRGDAYGHPI
jgi:hypothetical protein